jgi:hypothetical protein
MANGFGFVRPGQRPTPDSAQVGAALMQRGMAQPQMAPGMAAPPQSPADPEPSFMEAIERAPDHRPDLDLRRHGAFLMGGGGQSGEWSLPTAVGEALTRKGGGHTANPNVHKPRGRTLETLQQLGLSRIEAELLIETGGA